MEIQWSGFVKKKDFKIKIHEAYSQHYPSILVSDHSPEIARPGLSFLFSMIPKKTFELSSGVCLKISQ